MKHLLALVLLACPALADGSVYLGPNDTTITLDSPPSGYTHLEVSVVWDKSFTYGIENLANVPQSCMVKHTGGYQIKDGTVTVCSDRAINQLGPTTLDAFDGTDDCSGTSGMQDTGNAHRTQPAEEYLGTPSQLSFNRGWSLSSSGNPVSTMSLSQITATVSWVWKP